MRALAFASVLVGLFLAPQVGAADKWPVPRGPSAEPQPYAVDLKSVTTLPSDYLEESSACILYAGSTYRLEADGTVETTVHEATRLNGRKGVENLGEHRGISWDPAFEKVTLHLARVHKPDGKVVEAQPRDLQVRDVGTDYQVYDTDKQLIITFPTLGVGDILEVKWSVRGRNPEHAGHLFRRYSFGDIEYPIVQDELRVLVPKERTLKHACVYGAIQPTVKDLPGERYFLWRADRCKPAPKGDGLPSREELRPNVSFSTFTTWEEVGRWKHELRKKCWECTLDVKQTVAEVTRGLTDPLARAKALTHWMRHNIRYVSIGVGHHYTPHLPSLVLTNRYGDCKDGAQLLAVMLREAGLRVELVTLGVRDDGEVLPEVPSPWGTHAILAVTIDGKTHWIDTTSSLSGWDQLPRGDLDRMAYLTDDAGKLRLVRTPKATPRDNAFEQTTRLTVGNDGTTRFERTILAHGMAARGLRDDLLEVPPGERRRMIASELQDSFSQARLLDLIVDEAALKDLDGPVKLKVIFEVTDHFRKAGNEERDGNVSDSKIWGRLLSWTLDFDRDIDFELYSPFESKHTFEVVLPPAYTLVSIPRARRYDSPWAAFRLEVAPSKTGDVDLAYTMTTRVNQTRVKPVDFDQFREFQAEVNRAYRVWLTIRPVQDLEDAPLVEALLHWAPEDGDAASILARVYDSNGKNAEAQRVVRRSLPYAPKNRALLETAVLVSGPIEQEETARRRLVQVFPEEVKYQLELAATLVTRGKYDEVRKLLEPVFKGGTAQQQAEAHYQLARGHYRVDELKEAERELEAAEKADAATCERIRFRILQGQVAEELGKLDEARKAFELALRLNDSATFPREKLVGIAVAQKKQDEALRHLRRLVVHSDSDFIEALAIAEYSYRLGRYDDAREFALKAEGLSSSEKGRRLLGLLELRRGDAEKALPYLEKGGTTAVNLEALITCRLSLGQLDAVDPLAARAERSYADDLALRTAVSRVRKLQQRREELGRQIPLPEVANASELLGLLACVEEAALEIRLPERARKLTAEVLKRAPKLGPALAWQARFALEQGKLGRANEMAEEALRLAPGYWVGHYVRGIVALEREKGDAVAALREAVKLTQEKDAPTLLALGRALIQSGKLDDARTEIEKAARLQPDLEELPGLREKLRKEVQP